MTTREDQVKQLGRDCGFDLVRIADASPLHLERARYLQWIEEGRQGEMAWMTHERAERASAPSSLLADARSVITVALSYWGGNRPTRSANGGAIARYAWGRDYHAVLGERLAQYVRQLSEIGGGVHRWYVDTGPVMDKALAARSGLGWYGKNTNILTESFGSFVLLGEIITSLQLHPDPATSRTCGTCRACLVACPTGALDHEYRIDSRKCISYLTIEHRGSIPRDLRPKLGNWVFGCDICQDVCPPTMEPHIADRAARRRWLAESRQYMQGAATPDTGTHAPDINLADHPLLSAGRRTEVDLVWLLFLSHDEYVESFRGTAIRRAKVWMLRRNAAVALGNTGDARCIPALGRSLATDEHPVVRAHAAWALGRLAARLQRREPLDMLQSALPAERDGDVRNEIERSLEEATLSADAG
jgi:epoxyqueuosine reductase